MSTLRLCIGFTFAIFTTPTHVADASLRDALVPPHARSAPVLANAIQPLSGAIGNQVAKQIPTLSTSAGYTFEFNFATDVYERSATTFGPIFTERAVTIGKHKLNLNVSYSYIHFDTYNGRDLNRLHSRNELANVRDVPGLEGPGMLFAGIRGEDGYLTQLGLNLDLEAQLFELSATYGVLDHLDVNVVVPIVRTFVRSRLHDTTPDPRCVGIGIGECDAIFRTPPDQVPAPFPAPTGTFDPDTGFYGRDSSGRDSALGIGDIHLRAKYRALRDPVAVAGLLDLTLPSGREADFQGTGDTSLLPLLIVSRDLIGLLELHGQAGINVALSDIHHSEARYAIGVTGQPFDRLALSLDVLGRSEFEAQGSIPKTGRLPEVKNGEYVQSFPELDAEYKGEGAFTGRPYFVDIHRNDIIDLAIGAKVSLVQHIIFFTNFLVPLNRDGLRADFVPTVGFEGSF